MYKIINTFVVHNTSLDIFIPMDDENSDYQEYLKWIAAGNTPIPAD